LFNNVTNEDVEIAFVDDLCQHLKEIVEDALVRFSLYTGDQSKTADDMESKNSNEENMEEEDGEEDDKEDDEGSRGRKYDGKHRNMKKRKKKINLTSNYFEDEVHELKRKCSSKLV
jgi:TATA-binding protein-associated factor Taf7